MVKTLPSSAVGAGSIPHDSGTKKQKQEKQSDKKLNKDFKMVHIFLKKVFKKSCYLILFSPIFGCFRHEGKFSFYFSILA